MIFAKSTLKLIHSPLYRTQKREKDIRKKLQQPNTKLKKKKIRCPRNGEFKEVTGSSLQENIFESQEEYFARFIWKSDKFTGYIYIYTHVTKFKDFRR